MVSQFAAIECLKLGREYCLKKRRGIEIARSHFQNRLESLPSICFPELNGAFYAFLELPGVDMNDIEIVKYLVREHRVAVVPGVAFGVTDRKCLRASYGALEPDTAVEGINRLTGGLKELLRG